MIKRCFALFCVLAACASAQTTLFFDDFSGSSATDLNGTAPDIRPGSETWTSGTGAGVWKADGSIASGGSTNAFLPFTPTSGYIYTLSLDANPTAGTSTNWFALGFSQFASLSDGFQTSSKPAPWLLLRDKRSISDSIQTFLGPNTTSGTNAFAGTGAINLKIVLDTTGSDWAVTWLRDGVTIRTASFSGGNPTINYVGIGAFSGISGVVDNFTLTTSAIPEPATYALGMAVAAGCVMRLRRKKPRSSA